jgi:hypothetical protein
MMYGIFQVLNLIPIQFMPHAVVQFSVRVGKILVTTAVVWGGGLLSIQEMVITTNMDISNLDLPSRPELKWRLMIQSAEWLIHQGERQQGHMFTLNDEMRGLVSLCIPGMIAHSQDRVK